MATTAEQRTSAELGELREYVSELVELGHVGALLDWDEKTHMPPKGLQSRARQLSIMAGLIHERRTSESLLRRIEAVEAADPGNDEARVMRRDFEQSTKIPGDLVRELAEKSAHASHAWESARSSNDFDAFAPHLEDLLELCRRKADYLGYEVEPYDALIDIFEEGMTASELAPLFEQLRQPIAELVAQQPEPDTSVLERVYPLEAQQRYCHEIAAAIGYDMQAGRIDPTVHPFCTTVGYNDTRLTTRYDERWLPAALFSVLHEAGHGIYNQSFSRLGLPSTLGDAPGLGMHESQSRMFENVICRGRAFWEHHYEGLQQTFPEALADVDVDGFVASINVAQPSLIRVEADELTYNMHVALRFELERQLVNGSMKVRELPEAWNDGMERWVGVRPDNHSDGCLQDVHWSLAAFGYFPTYTVGNIYAAQFVEVARRDIGELDSHLSSGDMAPLLTWLDRNIYQHGCRYTGRQFVERIAGGPISAQPLIDYLTAKFG